MHASAGDFWTLTGQSGSVFCGVTAPFSWVLVHIRFCLCQPRVCFPVPCKFWWLFGGVNGDLLQAGLCHTQLCCIQSPCPCGNPLLTDTSTGDTQHSFVLVSVGVFVFRCTQGWLKPSEHLWWVWGLILNMILPLLPSCWGLSFVFGCGVSPHSHSFAIQPLLQCLASCWGFFALGHGVSPHSCSHTMHPSYISNGHPWI